MFKVAKFDRLEQYVQLRQLLRKCSKERSALIDYKITLKRQTCKINKVKNENRLLLLTGEHNPSLA